MTPDLARSIQARLLNRARADGQVHDHVLVRYGCERFLYRLGASALRERCTLKGAGLISLWMEEPYRSTRDVDLLAAGASDEAAVREIMGTVCAVPCPEDGLEFDLDSLTVSPIRETQRYVGQRARLVARLGKARIRVQVDFGFGDAVASSPEEAELPTLLDTVPAPVVRAYSRETSIAEKLEAMVTLGPGNSRMKDFHDVWALSEHFAFDGAELARAIAACFERRETAWTDEVPIALTPAFGTSERPSELWRLYVRKGPFRTPPPAEFDVICERVRAFLGPIRASLVAGEPFESHWPPGGPWRAGRIGER